MLDMYLVAALVSVWSGWLQMGFYLRQRSWSKRPRTIKGVVSSTPAANHNGSKRWNKPPEVFSVEMTFDDDDFVLGVVISSKDGRPASGGSGASSGSKDDVTSLLSILVSVVLFVASSADNGVISSVHQTNYWLTLKYVRRIYQFVTKVTITLLVITRHMGTGHFSVFTPTEAGTLFSDPGGKEGCVILFSAVLTFENP